MHPAMTLYGHLAGHLPRPVARRLYGTPWLAWPLRRSITALVPRELQAAPILAGPLAGKQVLIYPRYEMSFISGLWEYWVQDALLRTLQPGDRAWDLGAYIGYYTLLLRECCGPDRVWAVEPDPVNRARLERILALNAVTDVHVLPVAAGPYNGVLGLVRHDTQPATSRTQRDAVLQVPVRTLDALLAQAGAPRLIKLDVEGAEAKILRAALQMLTEVRPHWIVEVHGEAGRDAVAQLQAAGYRIRLLNAAERCTHQEHILAVP